VPSGAAADPGRAVLDCHAGLRNIARFHWEMVSTATGEAVGGGLEVLVLDDQGRIVIDSQFVEC